VQLLGSGLFAYGKSGPKASRVFWTLRRIPPWKAAMRPCFVLYRLAGQARRLENGICEKGLDARLMRQGPGTGIP